MLKPLDNPREPKKDAPETQLLKPENGVRKPDERLPGSKIDAAAPKRKRGRPRKSGAEEDGIRDLNNDLPEPDDDAPAPKRKRGRPRKVDVEGAKPGPSNVQGVVAVESPNHEISCDNKQRMTSRKEYVVQTRIDPPIDLGPRFDFRFMDHRSMVPQCPLGGRIGRGKWMPGQAPCPCNTAPRAL